MLYGPHPTWRAEFLGMFRCIYFSPLTSPPGGDIMNVMFSPKNPNERILHRLKIAAGHLNKVVIMQQDGNYCIDILLQSQAVQKALEEVNNLILENHLKTCVATAIKEGKTTEVIGEVMRVMAKK